MIRAVEHFAQFAISLAAILILFHSCRRGAARCYSVGACPILAATGLFGAYMWLRYVYLVLVGEVVFPLEAVTLPLAAAVANGILLGWAVTLLIIAWERLHYG